MESSRSLISQRSTIPDINNKVNLSLKSDISKLDQVAKSALLNAERFKIPSNLIQRANKTISAVSRKNIEIPDKNQILSDDKRTIEQNKCSNAKRLKPLAKQQVINTHLQEKNKKIEYELIPSHKYPFNSNKFTTIEELKSKVYKGTTGVIPVRHSQALEELNFILKGKLIVQPSEPIEEVVSDDDLNNFHLNLNTPVASQAFDITNEAFTDPKYAHFYKNYEEKLPKEKPAILSYNGTLNQAKFSERPKPGKKPRILPKVINRELENVDVIATRWRFLLSNPNATEHEIKQFELENQMRDMLNEAKDIGSDSSSEKNVYRMFRRLSNRSDSEDQPATNMWGILGKKGNNRRSSLLLNDVKTQSLVSVEMLISAIKSGELVKEQENSNKRIQDILLSILDEKTLQMFDNLFNEDKNDEAIDEEDEVLNLGIINEQPENMTQNSTLNQSQLSERQPTANSFRAESNRNMSGLFLESERNQTVLSIVSGYDNEMNEYLASLPLEVTHEDVINVKATQLKIFDKPENPKESFFKSLHINKKHDIAVLTTEEKYAKNLHLFCMVEHERRNSLLLPDELINVTRKLHTKNKFDNHDSLKKQLSKSPSASSLKKNSVNLSRSTTKIESESCMKDAAKRIFENLEMQENLEVKKDSKLKLDENNLENWRIRAENSLHDNYSLNCKKVKILSPEPILELALKFLRPAPAKMSIKPSYIKKNLFSEYQSVPPLEEDEFRNDEKPVFQKRSIKLNSKKKRNETADIDTEEENSDEENDMEAQLILNKLISRKHGSESHLELISKVIFTENDNDIAEENTDKNLSKPSEIRIRTLSDTVTYIKPIYNTYLVTEENIKVDSNYSEAIEEALNQKACIKKKHKAILDKQKSFGDGLLAYDNIQIERCSNETVTTPDLDQEVRKMEKNSSESKNNDDHDPKVFFPKTIASPDVVVVKQKGAKISKKKNKKLDGKRLSPDILKKVKNEIFASNKQNLKRSNSTDTIKFPKKIHHSDDLLVRVPKKVKMDKKNGSKPNLLDFNEYKIVRSCQISDVYDEREWVRGIWESWFDEVIPQLDGTGGRPNSRLSNEKNDSSDGKLMKANSFANTPANETIITDEEDDEKKKNAVSPTPYSNYMLVEIEDDPNNKVNDLTIKLVENEIENISIRIDEKPNAFDLSRRGALYRKLGLLSLAFNDFQVSIDMEPNYVDAYWQRHLIYLTQNKKTEALADLTTVLKLNRTHGGAYLSSGDLCAEKNEVTLAISHYSNAIKYDPNNYNAYYKRAILYEIRGDVRMAMDDYLTTSKLNPKIHEAWFKHGMHYYNNKNWDYAIVDFSELIKHNPKNQSLARLFRGKCYYNLEEYQWALDDFSVALHLDPNDWQAYYHRGCLLRRVDQKQALQDLSVSLLLESGYDNLNAFLHRGILYTDFGRYEEAVKDFEDVLALDKEFAPAYVNLGIIYMNVRQNYWKAIKQFNLAIKSNPVYLRAYLCRAQAYRYIHDLKRAYIDYTKAIHLDPMNTQVYIYRGQVIFEMGDSKLASFCVQHAAFMENKDKSAATSSDPNKRPASSTTKKSGDSNASAMNQSVTQRAVVFSFLKNFNKAISVLDYELKLKPSGEIYNLLGRVYMKAKRWPEAVTTFEKSINHNSADIYPTKSKKKNPNEYTEEEDPKKTDGQFELSKFNHQELSDAYFLNGQSLLEMFKYQEAYNAFDKVINMQPSNAYAYYFRGSTRFHLKHSKCIQDFNKALSIDPSLFEAFLARACIYGIKGRFTKAILNCNEAIKLSPKSVRGYLYRGALKFLSYAFEYAISDLTEALNLDQTCALAYFNRALCYQKLNKSKNALKDYSTVLMLGKYLEFKVFINRGLLYYQLDNYANALKDLKLASEYEPEDHNIQHMIGVCLRKLEKYDDAVETLSEIYVKNDNFHDALLSRGNTYVDFGTSEAFLKAQSDYEHILYMDAKNLNAHINLAYLLQMTGRFKKAWNQFTQASKINSKSSAIYEGRAVVCLQMSNTDAALKDINEAIRLNSTAELFVNRGVIYQFTGDNVNAMRDYQVAILMEPDYGLAYYNSANILLLHRQYSQAIEHLNTAIDKCNMKDESTYQNRAIAKAFNEDASGAFKDLCEALKYDQYSSHIYMNRALLLYKMENFYLAEKDLSTAITLSPNDALLFKLRADCRGKLEKKYEAIYDYKTFMDLKQRNEFRFNKSSHHTIKNA